MQCLLIFSLEIFKYYYRILELEIQTSKIQSVKQFKPCLLLTFIFVLFSIIGTSQCGETYERKFPCKGCAIKLEKNDFEFSKSILYDLDNETFIEVTPNYLENGVLILSLTEPSLSGTFVGELKRKEKGAEICKLKVTFNKQNIFKISDGSKSINLEVNSSLSSQIENSLCIPIDFENSMNSDVKLSNFTLLVKGKGSEKVVDNIKLFNEIDKKLLQDTIVKTKVKVPIKIDFFTHGEYEGILQFNDDNANKFVSKVIFTIKHPPWGGFLVLLIGIVLGLVFKKISAREVILRNTETVLDYINYFNETDPNKYSKLIGKLNNLKELIPLLTQAEFDSRLNLIKSEMEQLDKEGILKYVKKIDEKPNKKSDKNLRIQIIVTHFIISIIISLFLFNNLYVENSTFGSLWDYLILIISGVFVSFTSGELLGDRLKNIFSSYKIKSN